MTCCEEAGEACKQHQPAVSDTDTVTFLSLCFSFSHPERMEQLLGVLGATLSALAEEDGIDC